MAIVNPQPPIVGGISYPFMGVSLAMSTRPEGAAMVLSLVVTLTPYRVTESGVEFLEGGQKVLVWGDAVAAAATDPHLAQFLQIIESAGQTYVSEAL
jgi:hypothetical protein